MDVVRVLALALFLLAPLAVVAAPVEVPELQEFHEAMMTMNPDNGTDGEIPKEVPEGQRGP